MTQVAIDDTDTVSRSIIHPTHFKETGGVLTLEAFTFAGNRPESVNCHRLLDKYDIHTLGVRLAAMQNEARVARGDQANRIYKGYIESIVTKIRAIREDTIYFDVVHHYENDNNAHCNIEIKTTDNQPPKKSAKSAAVDALRTVFSELYALPPEV